MLTLRSRVKYDGHDCIVVGRTIEAHSRYDLLFLVSRRIEQNVPEKGLGALLHRPLPSADWAILTQFHPCARSSYCKGAGMAEIDFDGPIWALIDTSHNGEKVASECRWFRAAAQSGEDEETCRALCLEADQKVARLVRTYR